LYLLISFLCNVHCLLVIPSLLAIVSVDECVGALLTIALSVRLRYTASDYHL
jgi:hypothetical protein